MPFFILITVLSTFLSLSGTLASPAQEFSGIGSTVFTLGILLSIPLITIVLAIFDNRIGKKYGPTTRKRWQQLTEQVFVGFWFASVLVLCFGTNWFALVADACGETKTIQFFAASIPSFGSLLLLWWANSWRTTKNLFDSFNEAMCRFKIQVLTVVAPLLCVMLIRDSFATTDKSPVLTQYLMLAIGLAILVVLMPKLICRLLPTQTIKETSLGESLVQLAQKSGTGIRDIRIWDTGDRMINALVVGMFPINRSVLLSDRLIRKLDLHEIYSVFLHEIGHAKRNHLIQRFLAAGLPFLIVLSVGELLKIEPGIILLVSIACSLTGLTLVARFLEYDADLFAVNCLIESGLDPQSYRSALTKIVVDNPKAGKHSWLHPPMAERIRRIEKLVAVPIVATSQRL